MKKLILAFLSLALCAGVAAAQTTPPSSAPPQPSGQAPSAQAPAQTPAAPAPPQAKTSEEHQAFVAATSKTDAAAGEAAAREFQTQYPNSEISFLAWQNVMRLYLSVNNPEKALAAARESLKLKPDNVVPLVYSAWIDAETVKEGALDRDQKLAEVRTNARHALELLDKEQGLFLSPNLTPEQVTMLKSNLRATAHAALGTAELEAKNWAAAEAELRTAVQTGADPYAGFRLALALDHQQKYKEALAALNQVQVPANEPALKQNVDAERKRLEQLSNAAPQLPTTPPPQ